MKKISVLLLTLFVIAACTSGRKPVTVYTAPSKKLNLFGVDEKPGKFYIDEPEQATGDVEKPVSSEDVAGVTATQPANEPAPVASANSSTDYDPPADYTDEAVETYFADDAELVYAPQEETPQDVLLDTDVEYPRKTGNPYVIKGITYYPVDSVDEGYSEVGIASWYGKDFHGKLTAAGEPYNMHAMTAAHKTLPIPTFVKVENLDNGKETVVRVNDRGPFSKGRIIDLSYAAAKDIDMIAAGTARVRITVLSQSKDHLRTENKDVNIEQGRFSVQLGAFSLEDNARRLADSFNNATVVTSVIRGQTFYRVQLKGYMTKSDAEQALMLLEQSYPGAFILAD